MPLDLYNFVNARLLLFKELVTGTRNLNLMNYLYMAYSNQGTQKSNM